MLAKKRTKNITVIIGGMNDMWGKEDNRINRRDFLKTAGIAGVGSVIAGTKDSGADANEPNAAAAPQMPVQKVPRRKLGKTGVEVPAGEAMTTEYVSLRPGDLLVNALEHFHHGSQQDFPVIGDNGIEGVLTRTAYWRASIPKG